MKRAPILLGCRQDGYCRCTSCKPARTAQRGMTIGDIVYALIILLIVMALATIMPGGR